MNTIVHIICSGGKNTNKNINTKEYNYRYTKQPVVLRVGYGI
jgi:hypothetical protein